MADKTINELNPADRIFDNDLFVLSQNGVAMSLAGNILVAELAGKLDGHGGIKSIEYASTSGLEDTYVITLADNTTFPFKVTNGAKGDTAPWYVHIKYWNTEPESNDQMKDTPDNWMGIYSGPNASPPQTYLSYKWFEIKGATGNGISSISLDSAYNIIFAMTSGGNTTVGPIPYVTGMTGPSLENIRPGQLNDYTMTLSNGDPLTVKLYAGVDGQGEGDMKALNYDPTPTGGETGVVRAAGGIPAYIAEAMVASAADIPTSVTYNDIADLLSAGRAPYIKVGSKIYQYALIADQKYVFVCPDTGGSGLDWISVSSANSNNVTSGTVTFLTSDSLPVATSSVRGVAKLKNAVDTTTTDAGVTPKAVSEAIDSSKLKFTDTTVPTNKFADDTSGTGNTPQYADFPIRGDIVLQGVTSSMIPEVVFDVADATSGNFAPIAETADPASGETDGHVYIYTSVSPTSPIKIPTIICWK